jgi:hypothetical protein
MTILHTTTAARIVAIGAVLLAAVGAGCSETSAPLPAPNPLGEHPAAAHDVRVRLEFGDEGDLDDPAPRVETVRFSPAPAGRYRVSVDFPIRCRPGIEAVPYRVIVEANGEEQRVEGTARFGSLERVVLEFEAAGR